MLKLEKIHKSFHNNEVLKGIDLEVDAGEVIVILGPSGSGKTTLLRCINFLEKANKGTIQIDDLKVDAHSASKKEILTVRRKLAMVFQQYNLFRNKTALENVIAGPIHVQKVPKDEAVKENRRFY